MVFGTAMSGIQTKLFKNLGLDNNYQFVLDETITFPNIKINNADWSAWDQGISFGDYNKDGFPDLLLRGSTGDDKATVINKLYKNIEGSSFQEIELPIDGIESLPNAYDGMNTMWYDYDGDGVLDIIVGGQWAEYDSEKDSMVSKRRVKIYKNNQDDTFSEVLVSGLYPVTGGNIVILDFNNDSLLDLAYAGWCDNSCPLVYEGIDGKLHDQFLIWFENKGQGEFELKGGVENIKGTSGNIVSADFDGDGNDELLLLVSDAQYLMKYNSVSGLFEKKELIVDTNNDEVGDAKMDNVYGVVAVGDFNRDGKQDFVLSGNNNELQDKGLCSLLFINKTEGSVVGIDETLTNTNPSVQLISDRRIKVLDASVSYVSIYDLVGKLVGQYDVRTNREIQLQYKGVYIVKTDLDTMKIIVR